MLEGWGLNFRIEGEAFRIPGSGLRVLDWLKELKASSQVIQGRPQI